METILTRMAEARAENRTRLRPYRVTRDYRLFSKEKQTTKSEVIADVTFVPPDVKDYEIQQANGTGLGEKIVRQMLEHEAKVAKNYSSTDISPANYDFRFIREDDVGGQQCYVLELLPRRKDKNLLRGKIWVDTTTYLLHRAEGEPAKALSWWLRDVRIALVYGDVGGMWLQTTSESTANVRLLGQHTMLSRDREYKIGELTADAGRLMSALATGSARGGLASGLDQPLGRATAIYRHHLHRAHACCDEPAGAAEDGTEPEKSLSAANFLRRRPPADREQSCGRLSPNTSATPACWWE